jgi:hypothetical protein
MSSNTKNKNGLDRFFELAKNEKVVFTKEQSAKIINKFAYNSKFGFLANLGIKLKLVSFASIAVVSTMFFTNKIATNSEKTNFNQIEVANIKSNTISDDSLVNNSVNKIEKKFSSVSSKSIENLNKEFNSLSKENVNSNDFVLNNSEISLAYKNDNLTLNNDNLIDNYIKKNEYSSIIKDFQSDEIKTIAFDFSKHNGVSISMINSLSKFGSKLTNLSGMKAVWIINKQINVGVMGYGTQNPIDMSFKDIQNNSANGQMALGYGGLFFEYIINPDDRLHYSINTAFGGGGFNFQKSDITNKPWGAFLILEPGLSLEYKVAKYFRIGLEGSYKLSETIQKNDYYSNDNAYNNLSLNGLSGGIFLKIGLF